MNACADCVRDVAAVFLRLAAAEERGVEVDADDMLGALEVPCGLDIVLAELDRAEYDSFTGERLTYSREVVW